MSNHTSSDRMLSVFSGQGSDGCYGDLAGLLKEFSFLCSSFDALECWLRDPLDALLQILSCNVACIALLPPGKSDFTYHVLEHNSVDKQIMTLYGPVDEELFGWVISRNEDYLANSLVAEPLYNRTIDQAVGYSLESMICSVLRTGNDVVAVVMAFNCNEGFSGKDLLSLKAIGRLILPALELRHRYEGLKRKLSKVESWFRALIFNERLASMSLMAAGVAHEIQSPLAAVSGYIQLMKKEITDDKLMQRLLRIETSINAVNTISNGLATFSRRAAPSWEEVNVNLLIREGASRSILATPAGIPIKVVWNFQENLPPAEAYADELRQVFVNIIDNACQAIPDGGVIEISTELEQPGTAEYNESVSRIKIIISDDGPGIPEKNDTKVFMPFFSEGKLTGAGLGLSLCRSVMKRHRGEITFQCPETGGTRFVVYVPVMKKV